MKLPLHEFSFVKATAPFCLLGNFVEIVLVSKKAPRGSHCGGAENVAIAIRRRRRMSQATFFIFNKTVELIS